MSDRCKAYYSRHWFTYYGEPGTSAPTCQHCGAPNPRYDRLRDPYPVSGRDRAPHPEDSTEGGGGHE